MSADDQAWIDWADLLAAWAMRWLVNRTDVYGSYCLSGGAITVRRELTFDNIVGHFSATDRSRLIGLHAISAGNTSRWIAIDIDQHDEDNPQASAANWQFVLELCRRIASYFVTPLVTESNGNGGYHVRILFDAPIPSRDAHDFGNCLIVGWELFGLQKAPEVYPKQPELTECIPIGNWLRLPGHHHTYCHTSRIWTGNEWLSGERAIAALVSGTFANSNGIPPEVLQQIRSRNQTVPRRRYRTSGRPIGRVLERLTDVRKSMDSQQWRACCPAHADSRPSLSVSETTDGKVLLYCHVGCPTEKVAEAMGLKMRDLFLAQQQDTICEEDETDSDPAVIAQPSINFNILAKRFCGQLTSTRLAELSARLGVSVVSLGRLNIGWDYENHAYTFPEFDVSGQVVGILLRADRRKWQVTGGQRGLILPTGSINDGPIFLPEGASDVAALLDQGGNAIGRPSAHANCGGMLIELLSRYSNEVIVVGDRDGEILEEAPGYIGAKNLATQLMTRLGNRVKYSLPPESFKDVREWLNSIK